MHLTKSSLSDSSRRMELQNSDNVDVGYAVFGAPNSAVPVARVVVHVGFFAAQQNTTTSLLASGK